MELSKSAAFIIRFKCDFIPTYDLFKYNLQDYLSADNFHPNSTGYQAISNRIIESLKNYK